MIDSDKYLGCFLGLAMGDAYGAPFEGGPIERLLWKIIGTTRAGKLRYTDDTQMAMDLAESFIENKTINQAHLASTFAKSYHWTRGYGPSAAWLLKKINRGADWQDLNRAKFKQGSFGNGAAMRAPILALCYLNDMEQLKENVIKSSEITHAHPLAIEGAKLIAFVTHTALHDWRTEAILDDLSSWCESSEYRVKVTACIQFIQSPDTLAKKVLINSFGHGVAAIDSTVTAIYFALKYRQENHHDMLNQIYALGGDTDTIGAMAGAIWGAFNGAKVLDENRIQNIENASKIIQLAKKLYSVLNEKNKTTKI